jgi:hypothetical protein
MRSEQLEYNDDPAALPAPCYEALAASPDHTASKSKPSTVGFLTLSVAWLFGLEALLSDDDS